MYKEIQSDWTAADHFMKSLIELRNAANRASMFARRLDRIGIYHYFSILKQLWINISPFVIETRAEIVNSIMKDLETRIFKFLMNENTFQLGDILYILKKEEELDTEIWKSAVYAGLVVPFSIKTSQKERLERALGVKKNED